MLLLINNIGAEFVYWSEGGACEGGRWGVRGKNHDSVLRS